MAGGAVVTVTTEELWVEARRLDQPIYEEGLRPVDSVDVLERFREDWLPRHCVAAMTLAVFAEFDARALRATARKHHDPRSRTPRPCGVGLLVSAALIAEKPPAVRANLLANGVLL
jgi:hypothetical protein